MAADAEVTFLLEKVTEVSRGYSGLISGAAVKEFKILKGDIETLKAALKDIDNKSSKEQGDRLIQLREVVYEVEDTIDSWLTIEAASKGDRVLKGCLVQISPNHKSLAKQVKALREDKVKPMLNKANAMIPVGSVAAIKEDEATATREEIRQETIVGIKDEKEIIKSYLMTAQLELDVISIVGMPGLGKTALAREVFNDDIIRREFPIRIWVDISQRINRRHVLLQIIKHFISNSDDVSSMSDVELLRAAYACLSRGKFLLVMDDVWKTEHWDELKNALPYRNGSGKVLITSREMAVSRHTKRITTPHLKRFLDLHESWELFQLVVFGKVERCTEEFYKEIGQHIAKGCKGVPLTILLIGGILKDQYLSLKPDVTVEEKWKEVAINVNLASEDSKRVILDVVELSYKRLPDRLRDCFLYLGVFPAGYEIHAWILTRLWIAEGYIRPEDNRSLEEIAEDNLNYLISRNLLMVQKMNPMREIKVCHVHDVIRMFCTDEAKKLNLFKEVRMSERDNAGLPSVMEKIPRLCLHSDLDKFFSADLKGPRVRSFLCFRKDDISLEPDNVAAIYENFVSLRILQSQSIKLAKFPAKLIKLNHLRYIVLCVPELEILPEQISQLWNLQTIVVDTNSNSLLMKASLWKMIPLRHLKTKAAIILEKKFVEGDQAGDNIQTLNRLSPESVSEVSHRAINLRTLGVRGNLAHIFHDMPSGSLNSLEKLKLYQAASENRLQRFPDWSRFAPNLKRLTLSNTFLEWKHMFTLAMIAGLEVLKLKDNAFTGICWEVRSGGFKRLQFLLIVNTDMVLWEALSDTFPCLKHLVLKNCENLKEIPDCILQRLENLEIERVRKSTADSARNSGAKFKLTVGVACDI